MVAKLFEPFADGIFPGDSETFAYRCLRKSERTLNQFLFMMYRFDGWHVGNGGWSRPYKRVIAEKINRIASSAGTVAEVGCGLGDILRHVRCGQRIGCDIDERVIRAARRRAPFGKVDFRVGDATVIAEEKIDVLIMVNWIHHLSASELSDVVLSFTPRTRYFVFDGLDAKSLPSDRYAHDFEFLRDHARLVESFRVPVEPRTFFIWKSE